MLKSKIRAFTLIELLVVLIVSSLLLSGLISMYLASAKKYQQSSRIAQLDQTLQAAISLMASDIERAGFWKNASSDAGLHANNNPFMQNDITINASGNCILLTYDKDGSGTFPSIGSGSDDKRYGFRLVNTTLQARPSGADYDCSAATNNWSNLTDPNLISITQLSFSPNHKTITVNGGSIIVRTVIISLTGQLVSDPSVTKTMSRQVRVRNDKYTP